LENIEICSKCKGACCKASGGHIFPDELSHPINEENLLNLLRTGLYVVDYWGNPPDDNRSEASRLYYIRYRHKGVESILDNSRFLSCILLTSNGCSLPYLERPRVCRELIPRENFNCQFESESYSKISCAIEWQKYQNAIINVLKKLNELD
jgi:Fe-S-cluster containining protein